jgi:transcriptional regulator with XRE-family HTH domain
MVLGNRIKQRREELHLSQEELAKKLGYKSRSTINKIELGKNDITQHKIVAFANALQTTPAYLMGWDDIDEETEIKNDTLSDIIIALSNDNELLDIVEMVTKLDAEKRKVLKSFLTTFVAE